MAGAINLTQAAAFRGNHLKVANEYLGGEVAMKTVAMLDDLLGVSQVTNIHTKTPMQGGRNVEENAGPLAGPSAQNSGTGITRT